MLSYAFLTKLAHCAKIYANFAHVDLTLKELQKKCFNLNNSVFYV